METTASSVRNSKACFNITSGTRRQTIVQTFNCFSSRYLAFCFCFVLLVSWFVCFWYFGFLYLLVFDILDFLFLFCFYFCVADLNLLCRSGYHRTCSDLLPLPPKCGHYGNVATCQAITVTESPIRNYNWPKCNLEKSMSLLGLPTGMWKTQWAAAHDKFP